MDDKKITDDFYKMVELAKFGANRHSERRQLEFRIFISYITLLSLFFYYVVKPKDPILQGYGDLALGIPLVVFLLVIHTVYFYWKRNFLLRLSTM